MDRKLQGMRLFLGAFSSTYLRAKLFKMMGVFDWGTQDGKEDFADRV